VAPPVPIRLDATSTLLEWLADPRGYELLRGEIGADSNGRLNGLAGDDKLVRVVGNFPLRRLATLPGLGLTPMTVARLLDQVA
jgi:beta-glucosidase